ncbi:MAG: hypothetical protein HOG76_06005 [Candidatus Marinimicrobia bacterium]|jgi:hypothetical protein|nr:hypothetical protein [Candidatus Neomarinimicrobiota bacterium]MBT6758082.1 hypothetical protein [Candidatus Neomarinimicrobiota bacterium]
MGHSSLGATPLDPGQTLPGMGTIAYINESDGRDAIFIRDASGSDVIFRCDYENEIVLTPSVSSDGKFITFLVDNGRDQKAVHILGPIEKVNGKWQADDYLIIMVRGGAWPVIHDSKSVYLSMPDQTSLVMSGSSNIYLISAEKIQQITKNQGLSSHIWPLINPEGNKLIYREIPLPDKNGDVVEPIKSILFDLQSGASEAHFVNQFVYMEQWTEQGEILFSSKERDENGNRIYALYNPETMETREIYRNKSRQGSLSNEARFLATIRPMPEGGADFDIFVTDLLSKVEINLTQSPKESESIIGWIK